MIGSPARLIDTSNSGYRTDYGAREIPANWKKVDLAWLLKRPQGSHLRFEIRVLVWDEEGKGCNWNLTQDFSSNPVKMEDWKHARMYAKKSIEMGALLTVVELRTHQPPRSTRDDGERLAIAESYRPPD